MSKNNQGESDSQEEFAFNEDNLFEIDINNEFDNNNEDQQSATQASKEDQRHDQISLLIEEDKSQQNYQSQENNVYRERQNNQHKSVQDGRENATQLRDEYIEGQDQYDCQMRQDSQNSGQQQDKQLIDDNNDQVESASFIREDMSELNIFQRIHIQDQIKKLSTKKDDGDDGNSQSGIMQVSVDDKHKVDQNNIFANNQILEQENGGDDSTLTNQVKQNQQNIFTSQQMQTQNQDRNLQEENIPQRSIAHYSHQSAVHDIIHYQNEDFDQESSNLLDIPVFDNDLSNYYNKEQNHSHADQQSQPNHIHVIDEEEEEESKIDEVDDEDEDDDDLDDLKNIANKNTNSQIFKQSQEFQECKQEFKQDIIHEEVEEDQLKEINQPITENDCNNDDDNNNEQINISEQEANQKGQQLIYEQNQIQELPTELHEQQSIKADQEQNNSIGQVQQAIQSQQQSQEQKQDNQMEIEEIPIEQQQKQDHIVSLQSNDNILNQQQQQQLQLQQEGVEVSERQEGKQQSDQELKDNQTVIEKNTMIDEQEENQQVLEQFPKEQSLQQEPKHKQNDSLNEHNTKIVYNNENNLNDESNKQNEKDNIAILNEQTEDEKRQKLEKQEEQKNSNNKSISEAPQTIASILQQLAKVFEKMIIPQSMVNMSLHQSEMSEQPVEFKTSATMQQQMNQLQNQVTSIQNSVLHIPQHLSEVTQLLTRAATTGIIPTVPSSSLKQQVLPQPVKPQVKDIKQKEPISTTTTSTKKEEEKKQTKTVEKDKKKKQQSSSEDEDSDEDNKSSEGEEESGDDDEDESEDEISELKNISSKFSSNSNNKYKTSSLAISSLSKGSSLGLGSSLAKKSFSIQPKNPFAAPKIITPTKSLTTSFNSGKNEMIQESSLDNIVINAASIGFKEPKLFINENERLSKSDDLEIEEDNLKQLYEYLNKLDQPSSFMIIKQLFTELTDEQIHTTIHDFKSEDKIGIIQLFLPKYAKCNSARIDYYYVDMIIPPPQPKKVESQSAEEQKDNNAAENKSEIKMENFGDKKKFEAMTDEQLLSYQRDLNLKKQALLDKKQNANPTSDRIKKIQQWNEMKEICSTVFERIAVLKGKRIQEVCDDFGVKLDEQ